MGISARTGLHENFGYPARGGSVLVAAGRVHPTSLHLQEVMKQSPDEAIVVYDEVGLHEASIGHINWLEEMVGPARYIKLHKAAWQLADYQEGNG